MSQFTKKAIIDSFVELSQEMPIDKITIKKITEKCGINRNTFYYYYQDVYALKEDIIYSKAAKLFVNADFVSADGWKSTLRFIGAYAMKNEAFIKELYNSMGRDAFGDYLVDVSYESVYRNICDICKISIEPKGYKVPEKAKKQVAYFYCKTFAETSVEWLRGKIETDPVTTLERGIGMLNGVTERMLINLSEKK